MGDKSLQPPRPCRARPLRPHPPGRAACRPQAPPRPAHPLAGRGKVGSTCTAARTCCALSGLRSRHPRGRRCVQRNGRAYCLRASRRALRGKGCTHSTRTARRKGKPPAAVLRTLAQCCGVCCYLSIAARCSRQAAARYDGWRRLALGPRPPLRAWRSARGCLALARRAASRAGLRPALRGAQF